MSDPVERIVEALGPEFEANARKLFLHATPVCEHDFQGWRTFDEGRGGERFCQKCGLGAMAYDLRRGL